MNVFETLTPLSARRLSTSILNPYVQCYFDHLNALGYARQTVRQYLNCLAHFAHWSNQQQVSLPSIKQHVDNFISWHLPRCCCKPPVQRQRHSIEAAFNHVAIVMVDAGIKLDVNATTAVDEQLQSFQQYLQQVKGLASALCVRRLAILRPLVLVAEHNTLPTPDQLRHFLRQELARISAASAGVTTAAVRSYLKFLEFKGNRIEHLLAIVGSPANWRLTANPQALSSSEVTRVLNAFPEGMPSRLRSYAMTRCLIDLGLRSSEVITLELEHIDWANGIVQICKSKSRRLDILPLPSQTGAALAHYIKSERPQTLSRRVFVRHVAPIDKPIAAGVVGRAVREAYQRAGLPYTKVHILRHTLASRLLETGGTLKDVADILRHRALDTSMIYAKIDIARLSAVAMPWPGSQS
jgi:site-specific recombinase XerD